MPIPKIYYHRDPQQDPPVCFCSSCGGEIYDPDTVTAVLEAADAETPKWLSPDVCTTIHNVLALRFPIYEEG